MIKYYININTQLPCQIDLEQTPSYANNIMHEEDGEVVGFYKEITEEEYLSLQPKEPKIDEKQLKISELKANLAATDYQAIKYAEGRMTGEEYAPIGEQRQAWRDEINELEK